MTTFSNNHEAPGDSGAVEWITDNGDYFAIGCISTGLCKEGGEVVGPQVPSIRNRNNLWWSDQ